jgi:hypothetical protein
MKKPKPIAVFWVITMYSLASYYQRFVEKYCVRLQDINVYFEDERQYVLLKGCYSYYNGVTHETTK